MQQKRLARLLKSTISKKRPAELDFGEADAGEDRVDLTGVADPEFLAIGLGATNMMAMLWSIAMGKRTVGVELRGDPSLGVHWNIREDFFHHLGLIDRMMTERYGEDRIPRRGDGRIFRLADTFYSPKTDSSDVYADEVISGFLSMMGEEAHLGGLVRYNEFIDDRWIDGKPNRVVTVLDEAEPPTEPDPAIIGRDMAEILDGPSMFQGGAVEMLTLLRRYLEAMEEMDLAAGVEPRVRLFLSHRVVTGNDRVAVVDDGTEADSGGFLRWMREESGFVKEPDGRLRILIEEVQELDYRGKFRRIRKPGTSVIDLGVPELFMIAQGFDSSDADRLGFRQEEVVVDHQDGRGPVVAQADYLAAFMELHVGGRLRRRIASEFDAEGNEYWCRQLAVGHLNDPEVGWILVQVPDFKTFDPILAGLVPPRASKKSKEYIGAYQHLVRDYYLEQVSLCTEIPKAELEKVRLLYGPKMFSLIEKVGADAQVAPNGVVAGDSFGNGHFLTSGGAITGMIGHASRVLRYWQARQGGTGAQVAIRELCEGIKQDTHDWLEVSAKEFSQSAPINLGAERIAEIEQHTGRDAGERATTIDATRRHRLSLVPLDPSDWRRLTVRSGQLRCYDLPPLSETHPAARAEAAPAAEPAADPGDCGPGELAGVGASEAQ